jgi:glycolate oxidase
MHAIATHSIATHSAAQADRAKALLLAKLGSRMLAGSEAPAEYLTDDSGLTGAPPDAVVLAESTADVAAALQVAHETGVPITPRAGGSGRTGGAVPVHGGIVLCTHQLRRVLEFDTREGLVVVEPGVVLAELHALVEAEGWFYPPDPNSAELCCLAGNVAENAAGPRALKYGPTRNYVLGIETMLPTGACFQSGRRTRKGVTGYDVTSLLVGSEGTLAAFGAITLALIPKPPTVMTLCALFPAFGAATDAVGAILRAGVLPRCLEFLDEKTLTVMRTSGVGLDTAASALLLIEVDGGEDEASRQAELVGNACTDSGATSVVVAQSESQRAKLWASRKQMSMAVRTRAKHKISEDVVVPRTRLGALVESVERLGDEHRIDALCYGHAGDGNLHVNFLWNDAEEKGRVDQAVEGLFRATLALGGTLSGEHGIGLLKAPFLPLEQPPALVELELGLKSAFDPRGVMNPGKIFPARGHGAC